MMLDVFWRWVSWFENIEWTQQAVTTAATIVLAVGSVLLWLATRRLVKDGEETAKRQLRAYVGVEKLELKCAGFDDANYEPKAPALGQVHDDLLLVTFRNFGLTPAYDVRIWVSWQPMPYPQRLPEGFDYPDQGAVDREKPSPTLAQYILHKDQSHTAIVAIFDLRPFIGARRQEAMLYLYGRIDYRDIYGRKWRMMFCQSWEPWSRIGTEFVPYQEHNSEKAL